MAGSAGTDAARLARNREPRRWVWLLVSFPWSSFFASPNALFARLKFGRAPQHSSGERRVADLGDFGLYHQEQQSLALSSHAQL